MRPCVFLISADVLSSDNETVSTDSNDVSLSGSDSSWVLSPEQLARHVSPVPCRDRVAVMEMADIERLMTAVSKIRGCKTPGCEGSLVPVQVKSTGLGGALCISFACDGCSKQRVTLRPAEFSLKQKSRVSICVQVAFILAGATHATYVKVLQLALGMEAVAMVTFLGACFVKGVLDELCEIAKQEMKALPESELGSWKRAVTTADGTWHKRNWHSKNATFTVRNYFTGALLYYMHLYHKGRDDDELYEGTSKSAEGYAARATFKRAKEEGLQIEVHWQDADSSSSNAVKEVFPEAEIMICGGHVGRAHRKQ